MDIGKGCSLGKFSSIRLLLAISLLLFSSFGLYSKDISKVVVIKSLGNINSLNTI